MSPLPSSIPPCQFHWLVPASLDMSPLLSSGLTPAPAVAQPTATSPDALNEVRVFMVSRGAVLRVFFCCLFVDDVFVTTSFIMICFLLFDLPMLFFVVDILFLVCLHESSQLYAATFYESFYESLNSFHVALVSIKGVVSRSYSLAKLCKSKALFYLLILSSEQEQPRTRIREDSMND